MLKNIVINMEVMEQMIYFWSAVADREKVSDAYLETLTDRKEMKPLYNEEFDAIEARKVLSSITNRELLNTTSKYSRKFWNNNMWMLEDKDMMQSMIKPIKVLNLEDVISKVNEKDGNFKYETVNIVIVPGTFEETIVDENTIYFNFFKIFPDFEGNLSINGKTVPEFFEEAILNLK